LRVSGDFNAEFTEGTERRRKRKTRKNREETKRRDAECAEKRRWRGPSRLRVNKLAATKRGEEPAGMPALPAEEGLRKLTGAKFGQ